MDRHSTILPDLTLKMVEFVGQRPYPFKLALDCLKDSIGSDLQCLYEICHSKKMIPRAISSSKYRLLQTTGAPTISRKPIDCSQFSRDFLPLFEEVLRGHPIRIRGKEYKPVINEICKQFNLRDGNTYKLELRPLPVVPSEIEFGTNDKKFYSSPIGLLLTCWYTETDHNAEQLQYQRLRFASNLFTLILENELLDRTLQDYADLSWLISVDNAVELMESDYYTEFAAQIKTAFRRAVTERDVILICRSIDTAMTVLKSKKLQTELSASMKFIRRNEKTGVEVLFEELASQIEVFISRLKDLNENLESTSTDIVIDEKNRESIVNEITSISAQASFDIMRRICRMCETHFKAPDGTKPEVVERLKYQTHQLGNICKSLQDEIIKCHKHALGWSITDGALITKYLVSRFEPGRTQARR